MAHPTRESEPDVINANDIESYDFDFGSDVYGAKFCWSPDRELNPQYEGVPDIEWAGLTLLHKHGDEWHRDSVTFDLPGTQSRGRPLWQVVSWEPLTLSPSILNRVCGWHGFIRDGKWVTA